MFYKRAKSIQQNDWYVCNIQCRYYKLGLRCAMLRKEERIEQNAINSRHYVLPAMYKSSAPNPLRSKDLKRLMYLTVLSIDS